MSGWKETIAADEDKRFTELAKKLRALQASRSKDGVASRGLHAKQHVGVVGKLVVQQVPEALRVGPFAKPTTWPVYVRYSNGDGAKQHDGIADVRGIALKLVGVPGKKVIPGLESAVTQDFLFIPAPTFPFTTPDEFVSFILAASKGAGPLLLPRLFGAIGVGRTFTLLKKLTSSPKVKSLAAGRYFTVAPQRLGDNAVKFGLFSMTPERQDGLKGAAAYREDLVTRLKAGPLEYSLRAQLFVDEATTPIEDPSREWPEGTSPFIEVAKLVVPQQDLTTDKATAVDGLVEQLSFDPWHSVEEMRPLGALMRARNHAYRESTQERKAAAEPTELTLPE